MLDPLLKAKDEGGNKAKDEGENKAKDSGQKKSGENNKKSMYTHLNRNHSSENRGISLIFTYLLALITTKTPENMLSCQLYFNYILKVLTLMLSLPYPNLLIPANQFEKNSVAYLAAIGDFEKIKELSGSEMKLDRLHNTIITHEVFHPFDVSTKAQLTALAIATFNGHAETVKVLLDKGAHVEEASCFEVIIGKDFENLKVTATPIMIASVIGHSPIIETLLFNKASIKHTSIKSGLSFTALQLASLFSQANAVECLIKSPAMKAEIDSGLESNSHSEDVDNMDRTKPIYLAAIKGDIPILDLLIKAGAQFNGTVLAELAAQASIEALDFLIEKGVDINENPGRSPIVHYAIRHNLDKKIIEKLIEHTKKSNQIEILNKRDFSNMTALAVAVDSKQVDLVLTLLEAGVEVNEPLNVLGALHVLHVWIETSNPLSIAVRNGSLEILKLLKKYGANFDLKDRDNRSLLHEAAKLGHTEIVEFLCDDTQIKMSVQGNEGTYALMEAMYEGHLNTVKALLDREVKVNPAKLNSDFKNLAKHHSPMVKFLLEGFNSHIWNSTLESGLREAARTPNVGSFTAILPYHYERMFYFTTNQKFMDDLYKLIDHSSTDMDETIVKALDQTRQILDLSKNIVEFGTKMFPIKYRSFGLHAESSLRKALFSNFFNNREAVLGCLETHDNPTAFVSDLAKQLFAQPQHDSNLFSQLSSTLTYYFKSSDTHRLEYRKSLEKAQSQLKNKPGLFDSIIIRTNPILLAGRGLATLPPELVESVLSFMPELAESQAQKNLLLSGYVVQRESDARRLEADQQTNSPYNGSLKRPRQESGDGSGQPETKKPKREHEGSMASGQVNANRNSSLKRKRDDDMDCSEPETKKLSRAQK